MRGATRGERSKVETRFPEQLGKAMMTSRSRRGRSSLKPPDCPYNMATRHILVAANSALHD